MSTSAYWLFLIALLAALHSVVFGDVETLVIGLLLAFVAIFVENSKDDSSKYND